MYFLHFDVYKNNTFQKRSMDFQDCFRYPGVSKDKIILVLGLGDTSESPGSPESPEIIEMISLRFSHKQIENL